MLGGTALAGSPDWPCEGCEDIEAGYTDIPSSDGRHTPMCNACAGYFSKVQCSGGKATCTSWAVCSSCGGKYGYPLGHDASGTPATCIEPQVCAREGCNAVLDSAKGHDYSGTPATCTEPQICAREGCNAVLEEAKGHDYSGTPATCTEPQVCAREGCNAVLEEAKGHDYSGTPATCTEPQVCTVCNEVLNPAKGHAYTAKTIAPTCTEDGYTIYTCRVCGDSYKDGYTASRSHWYGLWNKNDNGTHSADCRRCGYALTVDCAADCGVTVMAATESAEAVVWDVCPVCGRLGESQLLAYETPVIRALDENAIPGRGEPVVFGLEAPFDGALYALTAAYEYAGKVEALNGLVEIAVPVELEAPFRVVRVDVTPATEETERAEVWTEIPFSYENGELTFETDIGGLFLLIPAE